MPRKTISLDNSVISILDSRKNEKQSYSDLISGLIQSSQPIDNSELNKTVGVVSGTDAYGLYSHEMGWVTDTKKKILHKGDYAVTPTMREEGYDVEPLIFGIICPFLKNVILNDYRIETDDNKRYSVMVEAIEDYLSKIQLMKVFRDDFEDYVIKHGHSYRRKEYEGDTLRKLHRLETRAMITYQDPFNDEYVAYHQKIYASDIWSSTTTTRNQEINSWWIPGGKRIIEDEGIYEEDAKEIWRRYVTKYSINETARLRVGDSDEIIAMHRVRPGQSAPIDGALNAIWEKRTLLANIPNVIYNVLMPFIHLKFGVMTETVDTMGNKKFVSSVPEAPPSEMATTDPERYTKELANYNSFVSAVQSAAKNINKYRQEGGIFASGPNMQMQVIESASAIAPAFIQMVISQLNEDIGQAFGFPVSLIMARGTELATSRAIQDLFNTVYAGSRQDYESITYAIIEEQFAGSTWNYEITDKYGQTETGTYTFEEANARFKLNTGDVTDNLKQAQTELVNFQTAQIAKTIGASKADIQAFFDEREQGLWDFDNFDSKSQSETMFGLPASGGKPEGQVAENKPELPASAKPELPAELKKESVAEQIQSSLSAGITQKKFDIEAKEVIPKKKDTDLAQELYELYREMGDEMKNIKLLNKNYEH